MEQEKQTQLEQKKKRLSTPLLIFIILMAVTAVLCAIVAGIWLHGRSSLRNGGSAPTVTPGGTEQLDSYTVLHDGKYYRYKDHMVNLLLIGVDSDNKPAAPLPYGSDNQADVILVAALDTPREEIWRPGRRSTWTKSSSASGSSPPTTTTAPASAGTW